MDRREAMRNMAAGAAAVGAAAVLPAEAAPHPDKLREAQNALLSAGCICVVTEEEIAKHPKEAIIFECEDQEFGHVWYLSPQYRYHIGGGRCEDGLFPAPA